jgi:inner membrane protein
MASWGHVAVGMAAGRIQAKALQWQTFVAFAALSLLPDVDVIAFAFRIPYAAPWGHRGAAHSIALGIAAGALAGLAARSWRTAAIAIPTVVSHGVLDTLTDGGLGVALLWPFTDARYFAPWRPIPVAPIGAGMLSARGFHVLCVELALFAPLVLAALWPRRR